MLKVKTGETSDFKVKTGETSDFKVKTGETSDFKVNTGETSNYKVKAKAALYPLIISQLKYDGHIYVATELERLYGTSTRVNPTNSLLDLITSHLAHILGDKYNLNTQGNKGENSPMVAKRTKIQDNNSQCNTSEPHVQSNKENTQATPEQSPVSKIENSHLDILDYSPTLLSTWSKQEQLSPEANESRGDCKSEDSSRKNVMTSRSEVSDTSHDSFHHQVGIGTSKQERTCKQDAIPYQPKIQDDIVLTLSNMMITPETSPVMREFDKLDMQNTTPPVAYDISKHGMLSRNTSTISPASYDFGKPNMLITNTPKVSPEAYEFDKPSMLIINTPKTSPEAYEFDKPGMLIINTPKTSPEAYEFDKPGMRITNASNTSPQTYEFDKSGMRITNTTKTLPASYDVCDHNVLSTNTSTISPASYDFGKSSMPITNTPKTSPISYNLISNENCHNDTQIKWEQNVFRMKDMNDRGPFIQSNKLSDYISINNQQEFKTTWNPILDRERIGVIGQKKLMKKPSILNLTEDEKFIIIREIGVGGEINIVKANIQELVPRTGYFSFSDVLISVFGKSAPYSVRYEREDKVDKLSIALCSFYTPLLMEIVGGSVMTVLNNKLKGNILFPSEAYIIAYFGDKWRRFPDVRQAIQFICGADLSGYTPLDVAYGMFGDCWCRELRFKMNYQSVLEMSLDPKGNNKLLRSS